MSQPVKIQGYISFPRQKLSDSEKTDHWYKKNIDFAEHLLTSDVNLRSNFKNKKVNYNLRANVISSKDFAEYRHVCGVIRGLTHAEQLVKDLVQKMEYSDE